MRLFLLFFALFFSFCFTNCNHPHQAKYKYYFFPRYNVYYNLSNSTYYFSVDGGSSWKMLKSTGVIAPALGDSIVMYTDSLPVYAKNAEDRLRYNAGVINVADDTATVTSQVVERKTEPTHIAEVKKPVKTKKGIAGFIKKIFGNKNNN